MQGGEDEDPDDGGTPLDTESGPELRSEPRPESGSTSELESGWVPDSATDPSPEPTSTSIFDAPLPETDEPGALPRRVDTGPTLPASDPLPPIPMVDRVTQPRPGAATWYRSDEERAKSVYRRANPWYRRLARGVVGLAFLGVAAVGAYAGARAIQNYLERDQLPAQGAEVPEIRATSFVVLAAAPAPAVDGTLTLDATTRAFEFVGRATGPQSGLQVVSPDGTTVYVRRGAAPWRAATDGEGDATAVRTAVAYLANDDSADDILTNRLRRGFVDLLTEVDEGTGDDRLTRYEMAVDTERFARDFPLQWQEYRSDAVPGAEPIADGRVTIWLDGDAVLMRVEDQQTNWSWERLTYSDQPFRPVDPANEAQTRVVQVACVSDDNSIFWQTPLASCDQALIVARETATSVGVATAFDDLDRTVARLCSTMEREDGPLPATADEAVLADALVEAAVCRGDPAIFTPG